MVKLNLKQFPGEVVSEKLHNLKLEKVFNLKSLTLSFNEVREIEEN